MRCNALALVVSIDDQVVSGLNLRFKLVEHVIEGVTLPGSSRVCSFVALTEQIVFRSFHIHIHRLFKREAIKPH